MNWHTLTFDQLSNKQLHDIMQLRQEVFVVEQECAFLDMDGRDEQSIHMFAENENGEILAYQRCLPPGLEFELSSIGRIVVAPSARGTQMGRELVQRGIDYNRKQWPLSDIKIGAQHRLGKFYASLGFDSLEDDYMEDGILHVHMVLRATA